jgi:hypothetical protein
MVQGVAAYGSPLWYGIDRKPAFAITVPAENVSVKPRPDRSEFRF